LRQLAAQLQNRVRDVDTLARLGGDEFGVLLEGCPLGKAQEIADALRQTAKEFRFVWEDKSFACRTRTIPFGFFLVFVNEQLDVHKIDPKRICFEITETAAIANPTRATQFIAKLKDRGCPGRLRQWTEFVRLSQEPAR